MTEVICPRCGTDRSINGTEKRVRCKNRECGARFYTKSNLFVPFPVPLVDQTITDTFTYPNGDITIDRTSKPYKSRWDPSDMSILRAFFKIITGTSNRDNKEELKVKLVEAIKKL